MEFSTGYQGKSIKMFNHKFNDFFLYLQKEVLIIKLKPTTQKNK